MILGAVSTPGLLHVFSWGMETSLTLLCPQAFLRRGTFDVLLKNQAEHRVKSPCCFHAGSDSADLVSLGLTVSNVSGYHPQLQPLSLPPVLCSLEGSQPLRRVCFGPSSFPEQGLSTLVLSTLVLAKLACF